MSDPKMLDGKTLVEVMGNDADDRWNIYVHDREARCGQTIFVKHENGHIGSYCVVSILEGES
jgi:hypothetical protein